MDPSFRRGAIGAATGTLLAGRVEAPGPVPAGIADAPAADPNHRIIGAQDEALQAQNLMLSD